MRLIDADALKCEGWSLNRTRQESPTTMVYETKDIDDIPTIEAEPVKHGQWIKVGDSSWECSVCHEVSCCKGNYCPDCGSRMESEK